MLPPNQIIAQRDFDQALSTTQGYILRGHKRNRIWVALIRFLKDDVMALRTELQTLAKDLTSARDLDAEQDKPNSELVVRAMGLTWPGYQALGLGTRPGAFSLELRDGFAKRAGTVTGRGREDWNSEQWHSDAPYHAIVILAAGTKDQEKRGEDLLGQVEQNIKDSFNGLASITWLKGHLNRRKNGKPENFFGFPDGISEPEFTATGIAQPAAVKPIYDPSAALRLALVKEPYPGPATPGVETPEYGSYLAFLKIEMHPEKFDSVARELAGQQYTGTPSALQCTHAKELIMGRRQDGASLVPEAGQNNFASAPDNNVWPHASHTRKMNPRTDEARIRRIVRRGCLYDEEGRQGVLFQCFQASLQEQFEFLFSSWANNPDLPSANCGVDPIVGYDPANRKQQYPAVGGETRNVSVAISGLTTIRGGEYFYFPSIPSLKNLTNAK